MRKLTAIVLLALAGWTWSISYTVQVAAVSDQESALSLVRNLLRDGYPAYFVRTTTEAGFVFRIRVGAFQNRGAALLYAETMPAVAGARPIPALAEAIPSGIMPLAPALLLSAGVDGLRAELLPWADGIALRMQQVAPLEQAAYYLLDAPEPVPFVAWTAAPEDDVTAVRVRDLPLWPEPTADGEDAPEVRAEFAAQLRRLIATQLGVENAVVDDAVRTTAEGVPVLVVVERFQPGVPDSGELIGLAEPSETIGRYGPEAFVAGADAVPPQPEPLLHLTGPDLAVPDMPAADSEAQVTGDAWAAAPDGAFARLAVDGASWRAAVGAPLWAAGDLLVTLHEGALLFYRFEERPLTEVP